MITVLGNRDEILHLLRSPDKMRSKVEAYQVALRLIELFGQRYAKTICSKLQNKREFAQICQACVEMQENIGLGNNQYAQLSCKPKTKSVLQSYGTSLSIQNVFKIIKRASYYFWPFPQKILQNINPEIETLSELEAERSQGFYYLTQELHREVVAPQALEHKEEIPLNENEWPLTAKQEMDLTRIYYHGGALVYKGKTVFFSELVRMWSTLSIERNQSRHSLLLNKMTLREIVEDAPNPVEPFLTFTEEEHPKELSFQAFLVRSSVIALQSNLKLKFSPAACARVSEIFTKHETTRSDLCYFSAFGSFYEMNYERSSRSCIRSFQLYMFLVKHFGIPVEEHPVLLNITLNMRDDVDEIPGLSQRTALEDSVLTFQAAWAGLRKIVNAIKKRDEATPISLDDGDLVNCSSAWDLLFFIWQHNRRDCFIDLLCTSARKPNFFMNFNIACEYCDQNRNHLKENYVLQMKAGYEAMVLQLETDEVQILDRSYLFMRPPLVLTIEVFTALGFAQQRTAAFNEGMQTYAFTKNKEYCLMLRTYILAPQPVKFELLKDCLAIGAEASEDLLFEVFSKKWEPFDPLFEEGHRQVAKLLARKIQDQYHFKDFEIFSIYLEILRMAAKGDIVWVNQVNAAVHELAALCPALDNQIVHYLFRYHPDIDPVKIAKLATERDKWAKNEKQLNRFVVSKEIYDGIIAEIDAFVTPLAEISPEEGHVFFIKCQRALLSAFFPPLQPLDNFFRVTNVTEAGGIRWGQSVWKTHEGQLKFILKQANVGIYFNWSVWNDHPVFTISFYNLATGTAFSAFIPIQISAAAIAPEHVRKPFWSLMITLGQNVLREDPDFDLPVDVEETPESWVQAFIGADNTIADFSEVAPQWEFYQAVKLSYRHLFLCSVGVRKLAGFPSYKALDIAGQGHIFPTHPRGALLPQAVFDLQEQQNLSYFIPDADEEFIESKRNAFQQSTENLTPLNLSLHTPDGEIPISYRAQTVNEFVGEDVQENRNEIALSNNEIQGRYIALSIQGIRIPLRYPPEALASEALFRKYFDYHNLLLKSAYYFTKTLK